MTLFKRKQYVIDKKFQFKISFKAVGLSLLTILVLGSVLVYFANRNNEHINKIVQTQDQMIEMFLTTPALLNSDNPTITGAEETFKNNIGKLIEIKRNSEIVLYFIVFMLIIQSMLIFVVFIITTHRISGPIFVMTKYLREIREGKAAFSRPLRKKDELKEFHSELQKTIDYLLNRK